MWYDRNLKNKVTKWTLRRDCFLKCSNTFLASFKTVSWKHRSWFSLSSFSLTSTLQLLSFSRSCHSTSYPRRVSPLCQSPDPAPPYTPGLHHPSSYVGAMYTFVHYVCLLLIPPITYFKQRFHYNENNVISLLHGLCLTVYATEMNQRCFNRLYFCRVIPSAQSETKVIPVMH